MLSSVSISHLSSWSINFVIFLSEDVGDEVPKFRARLVINEHQVMSMEDQEIEWAEYKVQHFINKKVKGERIESIAVLGLDTTTGVA